MTKVNPQYLPVRDSELNAAMRLSRSALPEGYVDRVAFAVLVKSDQRLPVKDFERWFERQVAFVLRRFHVSGDSWRKSLSTWREPSSSHSRNVLIADAIMRKIENDVAAEDARLIGSGSARMWIALFNSAASDDLLGFAEASNTSSLLHRRFVQALAVLSNGSSQLDEIFPAGENVHSRQVLERVCHLASFGRSTPRKRQMPRAPLPENTGVVIHTGQTRKPGSHRSQ